jgi:pimeloyl-ACP methyl ester carboxylesterase
MNIVILHGWGHNAEMWENFAFKFHGHKVISLDLPGFGNEKLVSPDWDISDYAKWVVKKLKSKKIKKAIFIGHSFGGKIATEIAINNPSSVEKLVLISAPVLRRPSIYIKTKIALYKSIKKILPLSFRKLFFVSEYKDANTSNLGEIFKNSVEYDRTKQISNLKIPVLIIWGEKDSFAPQRVAKEMHNLFPDSKLEIIKNAGHNLQFENSNVLYGLIKKFINEAN